MNANEAFPLSWPVGWPRTRHPTRARFGAKGRGETLYVARSRLQEELRRLGATGMVISSNIPIRNDGLPYSNVREPADHGVAVYFQIKGEPRVLAVDKWDRASDNLVAIALHVEAIRGQLRWGVGSVEQAFGGYKALPAVGAPTDWRLVLGVTNGASWDDVRRRRRELLEQHHPDRGGDAGRAAAINEAFSQAERELCR
jgi:DnaJ-domain-containing protein 1